MITYHEIRAKQAFQMYGELFDAFFEKYNALVPTMDRWTEQERTMVQNTINHNENIMVECHEEMATLEGDPRCIAIRKHVLRAITTTRLGIRYLNNTDAKYNPNALVSAQ